MANFFEKLQKVIESELSQGGLKADVRNKYKESQVTELHIELCVDAGFPIKLLIVINHFFPKKEGPVVYCLSNIESAIVEKESRMVFYQKFLSWKEFPQLLYVVKGLEKFWKENRPVYL